MTYNDKQWIKFGRTAPRYVWNLFWFAAGMWFPKIVGLAIAADTLPSVSPPTDWTGVIVVCVVGVLAVAITGYILYLKRPGMQFGEETVARLYDLLGKAHDTIQAQAATIKANAPPTPAPPTALATPTEPPAKFPSNW